MLIYTENKTGKENLNLGTSFVSCAQGKRSYGTRCGPRDPGAIPARSLRDPDAIPAIPAPLFSDPRDPRAIPAPSRAIPARSLRDPHDPRASSVRSPHTPPRTPTPAGGTYNSAPAQDFISQELYNCIHRTMSHVPRSS